MKVIPMDEKTRRAFDKARRSEEYRRESLVHCAREYGPEWERRLLAIGKPTLVQWLKETCLERDRLAGNICDAVDEMRAQVLMAAEKGKVETTVKKVESCFRHIEKMLTKE